MLSSITEFFGQRAYGKQFVTLFEQIAQTITGEYIQEIYDYIDNCGAPPTFGDIMTKVKALSTELTMRAEWMRDNYKENKGYRSIKLTTGCKRVIKNSVDAYLRQVKSINSISRTQHRADVENRNYNLELYS